MTYDDAAAGAHGPARRVHRQANGTQLMHASWALLPTIAVIGLGIWLLAQGGTAADVTGLGLVVLGVFVGIVLATVFSAVGGYARAIYRYATGQATSGVEPRLLAGAFRSR